MKRLFSRGILGSLALLIWSVSAGAAPTKSWAESYGVGSFGKDGKQIDDPFYGSGSDYPSGIAKMPDGGYVVAGQLDLPELYRSASDHTGGRATGALVRFAPDGAIVWQQVLRQSNDRIQDGNLTPSVSHIYEIATDSQGHIFIAGGKGNPDNGGQQPFVAKFNADGSLVWDNGIHDGIWRTSNNPETFEKTGIGPFTAMGLTHDGGVVAGTFENKPGGGQSRPVICKFNSDGSLALHAVYEVPVQYIGVECYLPGQELE